MKVGVLGMGSIGKRHLANIKALGHQAWGWDPDPHCATEQSFLGSRTRMISESDAIVIASPSASHLRDLDESSFHNKHVLVEKPIASTSIELGDLTTIDMLSTLLATRKAGNLVTMVGCNLRFHPCVQQAKWWMDNGDMGQPLWALFTSGAMSVKPAYLSDGVLMITGAHEVDLALHLLGPVSEVLSADVHCTEHGDDIADFVLQHENGARSSFHLDFVTPNEIRESWIAGTEKNIGIDLLSRRASLGAFVSTHDGDYAGDYVEEMRAFIQRIEGVEVPGATGEDGLAVLKVLLDIRRKAGLA